MCRLIAVFGTYLLFLSVAGCVSDQFAGRAIQFASPDPPSLQEWDNLSTEEATKKCDRLAAFGKFHVLKEVAKLESWHAAEAAAKTVAKKLNTDQLIEFCRELPFDGIGWRAVFYHELKSRERAKVVAYLREIAAVHGSKGRYYAYDVGGFRQWDEFVPLANADLVQAQRGDVWCDIVIANVRPAPISDYARQYLVELGLLEGKRRWDFLGPSRSQPSQEPVR